MKKKRQRRSSITDTISKVNIDQDDHMEGNISIHGTHTFFKMLRTGNEVTRFGGDGL